MKRISRFLSKISNYKIIKIIPFVSILLIEKIKCYFQSLVSYLLCRWWQVQIGDDCKFFGLPLIRCNPSGVIQIGNNCTFRSSQWSNTIGMNRKCFLTATKNGELIIGNHCGFSSTIINADLSIKIGDRVLCGANCTITDSDRHNIDSIARFNNKAFEAAPIVIEDDVWFGLNVVVLKGVTIGKRSVVAANSVVTKSIPNDVIAAGNPAKVIKSINITNRKSTIDMHKEP